MAKRILIIDDDYDTINLAQKILELNHFEVLTATERKEALQILKNTDIQLILLDVLIPKMDGFEFFRAVKQELRLEIPVLFFTKTEHLGDPQREDIPAPDGYIIKPFSAEDLIQKVMEYLS
ncbi:MAG: response regulator [Candidatus Hodarchaeota archaeon]